MRIAVVGALSLCCLLLLAGCFESKAERAVEAFRERDYETALALARELSAEGHPRGYEILALASAQGLGMARSYTEAMRWIEKAASADPAFRRSQEMIEAQITMAEQRARQAFEAGAFERAADLAAPLADYGSATGRDLINRLHTDHYVTLPGSELTWRRFWNECSGVVRREDEGADAAVFEDRCKGRSVVWEGYLVGRRGDEIMLRMDPGRGRVRQDLVVSLAEAAEPAAAEVGAKIRFAGVIAARGDEARPDRLAEGRILGPGTLSRFEMAREDLERRKLIDAICVKLVEAYYRDHHTPDWIAEIIGERREAGLPIRFYYTIEPETGADVFRQSDDGSWQGRLAGQARITNYRIRRSHLADFTADCRIFPDHERIAERAEKGEIVALAVHGGETLSLGVDTPDHPLRGD